MHLRPMAAFLSALFIAGGCDNSLPQDIKALESDADGVRTTTRRQRGRVL